jgi:hypothetical protein
VELVQKMRASVVSGGGSGGERIGFSKKKLFTLPDFVGYIAFASLLLHLVSSVIGLLCSRSFVKIYFSNPYEVRLRTNSLSG